MENIADYNVYISRMERSVYDKLFFVDKIFEKIDTFLDFGCANGELIKYVHSFMPDVRFVGYDIDKTMIDAAKENVPYAEFYLNWDDIKFNPKTTLLNISSVVHEIYSYCTDAEIDEFWHRVLDTGFKYIAVRDMVRDELVAIQKVVLGTAYGNLQNSMWASQLHDFEEIWGPIEYSDVLHFLLKYRYTENWEREVRENYLPLSAKEFDAKMENSNYSIEHRNVYTLPYLRDRIKKDLKVDIAGIPTHIQYILKLKAK